MSGVWEVDWGRDGGSGSMAWARNIASHIPKCRDWHLTTTGYLRKVGISTPRYRGDSWEVDWAKRNGKLVWARNTDSKMKSAHDWHWIDFHALDRVGLSWKPIERRGRYVAKDGYVFVTPSGMTEEEIALAELHQLWSPKVGSRQSGRRVPEHRLVALKKFGSIPLGHVVRHMNGIRSDNRPENLLLGTNAENHMDHNSARLAAMYWHNKYDELSKRLLV